MQVRKGRFHGTLGLREVGTQRVAGGRRRVSLQALPIASKGQP